MLEMDAGARRWLLKKIRENYWRIANWCDPDDLIQDGYLHYHRIVLKYAKAKTRSQVMALFKVAFTNHLHDLSKKRTKQIDRPLADFIEEPLSYDAFVERHTQCILDPCNILHAPDHVKRCLIALLSDQSTAVFRSGSVVSDTHRETFNERLCRIAGLDSAQYDLVRDLKKYLRG